MGPRSGDVRRLCNPRMPALFSGKTDRTGYVTEPFSNNPGVEPPSTGIAAPWMWRPFAPHRNTVRSAISAGSAIRLMPSRAIACALISSMVLPAALARCANSSCTRSVAVRPGWMMLTLTPSFMPSRDSPLVKFAIAALQEPPIRKSGLGVRAAPPPILTTLPCASVSIGQNMRDSRTQPKNFSMKPSCQVSSESSRKLPALVAPALLTSTSQRPRPFFTSACSLWQSSVAQIERSGDGLGSAGLRSRAPPAPGSSEVEAITVCAPSRANASAMPRPMPRLPPDDDQPCL